MSTERIVLYDYPGSICSQMARLVLAEKGVAYERVPVDIMDKAEQFEPWYTALNPKAVVPTLTIGDEIVTDTIHIVHRVDAAFPGPDLTPTNEAAADAMRVMMAEIMGLHYGVLLYSRRIAADGTVPGIVARGAHLRQLRNAHPDRAAVLDRRILGNERLQAILGEPAEVERHVGEAKELVAQINRALAKTLFVSADHYTLADAFASAALARFRLHGFEEWWSNGENANVDAYYRRMRHRPTWDVAGVVDSGSEREL